MTIAGRFPCDRLLIALCLASALVVCPEPSAGAMGQDAEPLVAPWDEPGEKRPARSPGEEPASSDELGPRDVLRGHGIDDDRFAGLTDGQPLRDAEIDTLLRILYWMIRDFPILDVELWAQPHWNVAELAEAPGAGRGQIFAFSGRLTLVEPVVLEDKDAERFEMRQYYRCTLLLEDEQPAVVFVPDVPKAWAQNKPIDEPVGVFGLLLKFDAKQDERPVPIFIASRIAWYPDTLLGNLGMDEGLLDDVLNGTKLGVERRRPQGITEEAEMARATREREAFYAMLAAVGRSQPKQLFRQADKRLEQVDPKLRAGQGRSFSVVPLFNDPGRQRGRLFVLEGVARRVAKIRVDDPDIVARFGIDHYYEMAVFTDDSQDNPIFFCVRELPEGMPTGDRPEFGERVRVAGFFFKTWAYRVPEESGASEAGRTTYGRGRVAPLLIGRRPIWYRPDASAGNPWIGAIAGGLFVLTLLGIWVALWQYGRGDKQFYDRTIGKSHSLESGISLNEIGLSADGTPDFSGLQPMDRDAGEKRGETAQRPEND